MMLDKFLILQNQIDVPKKAMDAELERYCEDHRLFADGEVVCFNFTERKGYEDKRARVQRAFATYNKHDNSVSITYSLSPMKKDGTRPLRRSNLHVVEASLKKCTDA
jgi:hypothetical protein